MFRSGGVLYGLAIIVIAIWLTKLFARKINPADVSMDRTFMRQIHHSPFDLEVVAERILQFEANTMYTIRSVNGDNCVLSQPGSPLTYETFYAMDLRKTASGTDIEIGRYPTRFPFSSMIAGRDMRRLSKALQTYLT